MSNGGFSDACRGIDHPNETETKIQIKTKTCLPLIKILKVLSLFPGLTHTLLRRSLYTAILLTLLRAFDNTLVHEDIVVSQLADQSLGK
jgi:hypothetical protein